MSRLTITVDRLVALLAGLALLSCGAACAVWGTDRVSPLTGPLDLEPLSQAAEKTWWPWAIGVGGAVLTLLAARWLLAHIPRRGTGPLKLSGTGRAGRLTADGNSIAQAAAEAFSATPGIHSARGRIVQERGQIVAQLNAVIDADADLSDIASSADETSAHLRHVLGRDDLRCQVQLRLARRNHPRARVH